MEEETKFYNLHQGGGDHRVLRHRDRVHYVLHHLRVTFAIVSLTILWVVLREAEAQHAEVVEAAEMVHNQMLEEKPRVLSGVIYLGFAQTAVHHSGGRLARGGFWLLGGIVVSVSH